MGRFTGRIAVIVLHGTAKQLRANLFSIRKEISNGFKELVNRNLERDDRHDQFLTGANLAHSAAKSKQYICTSQFAVRIMLTFVTWIGFILALKEPIWYTVRDE